MDVIVDMQDVPVVENVVLALMVSVVRLAVIHVSTKSVTDLTEIVHMVALRVLKKIAVILQNVLLARMVSFVNPAVIHVLATYVKHVIEIVHMVA